MPHDMIRSPARCRDFKVEATQRRAAFEAEFGQGREVAVAIRKCLIDLHKRLVMLVGKQAADSAFAGLVACSFDVAVPVKAWRQRLHALEAETCKAVTVAKAFRELAAFGRYGISLSGSSTGERLDLLKNALHQALLLEALTPTSFKGTELEKIILQAEARLSMDRGELVEPRSLAALGNVDEHVVRRHLIDGDLPCVRGRVPAEATLHWLKAEGVGFRDSIWQAQEPSQDPALAA